jgi:hypothetical protein
MDVGKPAIDQRADKIHRPGRIRMRLQQTIRVRAAGLLAEVDRVHQVAPIARQRLAVAGFSI